MKARPFTIELPNEQTHTLNFDRYATASEILQIVTFNYPGYLT
jgi:hypothetical protein